MKLITAFINQAIRENPNLKPLLAELNDKCIIIEFSDHSTKISIYFEHQQLFLSFQEKKPANTIIRASTITFLKQLFNSTLSLNNDLTIKGELFLAEKMRKLLQNLNIDWEEKLSNFTGDILAFRLSRFFKKTKKNAQQFTRDLNKTIGLYLQEERELLPEKESVDQFMQGVDNVRDATDRLEIKIAQFEKMKQLVQSTRKFQ